MSKHVLYAEDFEAARDVLTEMIGRLFPQVEVEVFPDGNLLVERLRNGSLDNIGVVITDNEMPGVNGSDIIRDFALKDGYRTIPFILLYGGDEIIGQEAIINGAYSYFLKPGDSLRTVKSLGPLLEA